MFENDTTRSFLVSKWVNHKEGSLQSIALSANYFFKEVSDYLYSPVIAMSEVQSPQRRKEQKPLTILDLDFILCLVTD
jgi:hypothetical protein